MTHWEVVVIGGGCNGLAAAALTAHAGRRTLVIEQRSRTGGLSAEQPVGAYHSVAGLRPYPAGLTMRGFETLDLASHGLCLEECPSKVRVFAPGRHVFEVSNRPHFLQEEFESDPATDQRYRSFCSSVGPLLRVAFGTPLHSVSRQRVTQLLFRLWRCGLGSARMLARVAPMSAEDFLGEFFSSDAARGLRTVPIFSRTRTGPWSPFGALQVLLHEANRGKCAVGGPPAVAQALHRAAEANGAEIRTGQRAVRITDESRNSCVVLESGETVTAASIIAACSPNVLYGQLLDPARGGTQRMMRARGTCAVLALALDHRPEWGGITRARVVPEMETMERAFDAVKQGRLPDVQALEIQLAPGGQNALTVYALQTPNEITGGWNASAQLDLQTRITNQLFEYMPELLGTIVTAELWTPSRLSRDYALPGGHLWHYERDVDQLLRPPPLCPVPNVYWAGGAHAESGNACAGGVAAARAVLLN